MKKINNIEIEIAGNQTTIVDALRTIIGTYGSVLNPIQDINGEWFISQEEWDCEEFAQFKIDNTALLGCFQDVEFIPVVRPFNLNQ